MSDMSDEAKKRAVDAAQPFLREMCVSREPPALRIAALEAEAGRLRTQNNELREALRALVKGVSGFSAGHWTTDAPLAHAMRAAWRLTRHEQDGRGGEPGR